MEAPLMIQVLTLMLVYYANFLEFIKKAHQTRLIVSGTMKKLTNAALLLAPLSSLSLALVCL